MRERPRSAAPTDEARSYRRAFWTAVAITVAAWLLPFGSFVIYPFSVLATWAHELGHGLAALASGGRFLKLEIFPGLSGMATTATASDAARALTAAGGLVGAPLLGAAVVALGVKRSWSRAMLCAIAAALALSVALVVRNPFGVVILVALGALAVAAALKLSEWKRFVGVQLVGIQLALSALRSWDYLFMADAKIGGQIIPSDVSSIARALGGPYWLWGLGVLALNLGLLYTAYRLVLRRLRRAR
jgi:hypothetical protein